VPTLTPTGSNTALPIGTISPEGGWNIDFNVSKKIPSPKKIKEAYPINPYQQEFCGRSGNECAIRMSETFDDLGIDISSSDRFRKVHTEGGVVHQPSAKAFADWLWGDTKLGRPKMMSRSGNEAAFNLSDFKGKSGLIYFVHPEYGGTGPGHIDVIYDGNIGSGFYENNKVWFWEFKNGRYVKN
jgi:hypothetical protein